MICVLVKLQLRESRELPWKCPPERCGWKRAVIRAEWRAVLFFQKLQTLKISSQLTHKATQKWGEKKRWTSIQWELHFTAVSRWGFFFCAAARLSHQSFLRWPWVRSHPCWWFSGLHPSGHHSKESQIADSFCLSWQDRHRSPKCPRAVFLEMRREEASLFFFLMCVSYGACLCLNACG